MTTIKKSSLRIEAPLIVGFFLVFIGLIGLLPREALAVALVLFFAFGVYTEQIPKNERKRRLGSQRLFSETEFVVPLCVPIVLGWTYLQMTLDGQTFTQRILGIIGCIVAFGMLWFYVRKEFSNTFRVGLCIVLSVCTFVTLLQNSRSIAWAHDFQKGFNKMVEEQRSETNNE